MNREKKLILRIATAIAAGLAASVVVTRLMGYADEGGLIPLQVVSLTAACFVLALGLARVRASAKWRFGLSLFVGWAAFCVFSLYLLPNSGYPWQHIAHFTPGHRMLLAMNGLILLVGVLALATAVHEGWTIIRILPFRGRKIGLSIFMLLFFFALAELAARLVMPKYDLLGMTGRRLGYHPHEAWAEGEAFSFYRAKPGVYGGVWGTPNKTVNRHGFISTPELSVPKPTNTIRVVFLGGSSTAGTGMDLPDRETWPWKVAERLDPGRGARRVEFINASVGGYTSFESYGRLWSRLRFFSPDIVVVYHAWNEMFYFTTNRVEDIVRWRPSNSWPFATPSRVAWLKPRRIDPWVAWSQILTRLRIWLWPPASGQQGDSLEARKGLPLADDFDHRGLDIWRFNLCLIRETVRMMGADLFVCKQATLVVPGATPEVQRLVQYHHHGFNHEAHLRAFAGIYRVIEEEIPEDRIIDVTPVSGDTNLLYDCVHPTPAGTDRIAEVIVGRLKPAVRSRFEVMEQEQ